MNETTIFIVAAIVVVLLLLVLLLRSRKQRVTFGEATPLARTVAPPARPGPAVTPARSAPAPIEEGHGIGSEVTAAIEDVVDQFMGTDAHASGQQPAATAGDTLTLLKGLGPKAAARLQAIGVTRFDQIAGWDEADVAAIDAQMGAFQGRIVRDRWVEQAALLAKGDRATFEQRFGNLGG